MRMRLKHVVERCAVVLLVSVYFLPANVKAAELVMFESPVCEWCEVWHEELGAVYAKTSEGRRAPLRRVDLFRSLPQDLRMLKGVRYTPTFGLMDDGREVGRILGYPGESFFWAQLGELLDRSAGKFACSHDRKERKSC